MDFVYLDLKQHISTEKNKITLGEISQIYCDNTKLQKKLMAQTILTNPDTSKKNLQLIDILTIIKKIRTNQKEKYVIISMGESECLIEFQLSHHKNIVWTKIKALLSIVFLSALCFAGSILTVMSYHNDIELPYIFSRWYSFLTGYAVKGPTILDIFYSIGLSIGILLFFRPFQKKESASEAPTPLEIQMRTYENDVYHAIDWNKEHEEQQK